MLKRIALYYASEGTGHRAAAEALREWFLLEHHDGEVFCVDVLDYLPGFLRWLVADGYLFMARYAPWAWGWLYKSSDKLSLSSRVFDKIHNLLCKFCLPAIERDLQDFSPDAVFFTHYFIAAPFANRNAAAFPTFCVDTDFLTHRFQRRGEFAASFAASREAVYQRNREGVKKVFCTGVPIAPKFMERLGKDEARRTLGLEKERTTVLLSGGGIGAGSVEKALVSLATKSDWQIVVLCGNNERLFSRLLRRYASNHSVRVEAFVPNIEDYYNAADIAVMKPGGLSLSEALTAELPLLLLDPIPGQEELNMRYIVKHGAAIELTGIERTASVVKNILEDKRQLEIMKQAASKLSHPSAALDILAAAEWIIGEKATAPTSSV